MVIGESGPRDREAGSALLVAFRGTVDLRHASWRDAFPVKLGFGR
jgi:hypothetical protein